MERHYFKLNTGDDFYISYNEADNDPVVSSLRQNVLFGQSNALDILSFTSTTNDQIQGTIIDCGCHIGTFAVPISFNNRNVICIDGSDTNIDIFQDTLKQDCLKNVKLIKAILDKEERSCSFNDIGPFGSISFKDRGIKAFEDRDLKSKTLDCLCEEEKNISCIKYDLEGSEVNAIIGSSKTIQKHRPVIMTEVNQTCQVKHKKSVYELFDLIESMGYYILQKQMTNLGRIYIRMTKEHAEYYKELMVEDVICVPQEKILDYTHKTYDSCFTIKEIHKR